MTSQETRRKFSASIVRLIVANGSYHESFLTTDEILILPDAEIIDALHLDSGSQKRISKLVFRNCLFKDSFAFSNYSNIASIVFDNCIFENKASFHSLQKPIEFTNNCTFKNELSISSENSSSVKFSEAIIESNLFLEGSILGSLILNEINSKINKKNNKAKIELNGASIEHVQVTKVYCSSFSIVNSSRLFHEVNFEMLFANKFELNGADIGLKLRIKNSSISEILVDNIRGNRDIEITNCKILSKANLAMHKLNRTLISSCSHINELRLWGISEKGTFFILEKTSITKLEFDTVINEGNITLREITIPSEGHIKIGSSNLAKTDFILCDFSKATLEFENSKVTEIFLSETDFPKTVRIENKVNHSQAQLAFGQLHTAFQKQGDTVRSLEYQSREIEAHYRKLKWFIRKKKPFVNFTWFNLWLNKVSNDFGRAWMRALIFTIALGILFFYGLVISTKEYHFGFPITLNSNLIKAFFKFMNPLRFFETEALFTKPLNLSSLSYLLDFGGRVFVAYGFYQTIQAFRRFGRK